jgi:hypothetical protein
MSIIVKTQVSQTGDGLSGNHKKHFLRHCHGARNLTAPQTG